MNHSVPVSLDYEDKRVAHYSSEPGDIIVSLTINKEEMSPITPLKLTVAITQPLDYVGPRANKK